MSDKENSPDDLENNDLIAENAKDVKETEEVDLSNIDDDFDDDDEFYAGTEESKSKWLNIVGITCFVLAGFVGVWQFWLSGVGKYEEKPLPVPVATIAPTPVPMDVPSPVEVIQDDLSASLVSGEEVILDENNASLSEELGVSVEMSEEEISDSEFEALVDTAKAETAEVEETVADVIEDMGQYVEEMVEEDISEVVNTLMPEQETLPVDNIEDILSEEPIVEAMVENVEALALIEDVPTVDETLAQEVTAIEEVPVEVADAVEDVIEDTKTEALAIVEDIAEVDTENIATENVTDNTIDTEVEEVIAPEETTEAEAVLEEVSPIEDTSEIVEKIVEESQALPEPKTEKLEAIVQEEFVEETKTIVPEKIEYGSLTPAQILERAVVVRPKPKRLIVVKKNSSSTSSRSILVAADRSLKQGSFADALSLYNDVLNTNPKDTSALMGKALTLQKLNHKEDALEAYRKTLDVNPNHLNAMTNYLGLLQGDDPMSSINDLKDMEAKNPKSAAIAGTLGTLYGEMKDVANAARYFNKAQALDPKNAVYPYNLAILSDRMGSESKALEQYQKTLQLVLRYGGQGVVSEQVVARRIKELTSLR